MADVNPYQAPESELTTASFVAGGSLACGLSGDYHVKVFELFNQGWEGSKGFKATFWIAALVMVGVNVVLGLLAMPFQGNVALSVTIQIISAIVLWPLNAGFIMLAVYRAAGRDVSASQITGYYYRTLDIILLNILMMSLVLVGTLLLVLPGIYLAVSYLFAMPLMLDKNLGIWEAMEASRKTIGYRWFAFFGFTFLALVVIAVASMLALVPLIWVAPWLAVAYGFLYTQVLGVESEV